MNRMMKVLLSVAIISSVVVANAQAVFPLRVDIDVSTKRSKKSIGAGQDGEAKVEQVFVRVKVRKSSGQPYAGQLTAELYVIGKQIHTGYYGVIDVIKKDFTFTKDNDNTLEFSSPMYALGKTSGNINVGGEYETYLLVIVDNTGEIIDTRSGRVRKEKGIAFIRELGPKTLFDKEGNIVGKADGKNSAFKAAIPTATDPGDDD